MATKVSIIIVSWNVKAELSSCIDSIYKSQTLFSYEIIVVDNASSDDSVFYLKKNHPKIKVIANNDNLGFGRANNQAAEHAEGEYLFILNPDTVLLPSTLDKLVSFMDTNEDVAICGPCVLYEDGSLQKSVKGFPTLKGAFGRHTIFKFFGLFRTDVRRWRNRDFDYAKNNDVDQLIGAALLIRRSVFEKHQGFDERFFMYYEEVDLCYRIKQAGERIVYYSEAEMVHLGGRSSKQVFAKKKFMMMQSLVLYLKKHNKSPWTFVLLPLFKLGVFNLQVFEWIYSLVSYVIFTLFFYQKGADKWKSKFKNKHALLTKYSLDFLWT